MSNKEGLKKMLQSNHDAIKKLIDDISEEESMRHDYEHCNHIRWQTGHLIDSTRLVLKLLGKSADVPDEWTELFGYGSTLNENASIYPSMNELKGKLYGLYGETISILDNIPAKNLDGVVELATGWKINSWDGIPALCRHEFYHAGQITVMRRVLGRDKPFG
jgi:hypothetical protein